MHEIARAAADAARVPDFRDVQHRGHRRRRVRHGGAVALAALAVVVVVGGTRLVGTGAGERELPQPAPRPSETTAAVSTAPVQVPYSERDRLQVGDDVYRTNLPYVRYAGGTTLLGADFLGGNHWYLLTDGRMIKVVERPYPVRTLVSPDGEVVVWVESTSDTSRRLVMWDVSTRTVIGETEVAVEVSCCDQGGELFVHGVDLEHRVIYSTDGPWLWKPGSEPVPIRGAGSTTISDPWPGGLMYQGHVSGGEGAPQGVYGTVDDSGRFRRVGTTPVDQGGLWSPDGTSYVFTTESGEVRVQREGEVSPMPVLGSSGWTLIAFESATTVVVERRGEQLARCDVVALECIDLDQVPTLRTSWPDNRAG